jgi:hypothetical protein
MVVSSPIDTTHIGDRQIAQLLNRKRWTKMDCIFEKLAFINLFHSNMSRHLLRFSRGRLLKICKISKNYYMFWVFYFGNKINIIFG